MKPEPPPESPAGGLFRNRPSMTPVALPFHSTILGSSKPEIIMGNPYYHRQFSSPLSPLRNTQCSKYSSGSVGLTQGPVAYHPKYPLLRSNRPDIFRQAVEADRQLNKYRFFKYIYGFMLETVSSSTLKLIDGAIVVELRSDFRIDKSLKRQSNPLLDALKNKSVDKIQGEVEDYLTRKIKQEQNTAYGKRRFTGMTNTGKMVSALMRVSFLLSQLDILWGIYKEGDNKDLYNKQNGDRKEEADERKVWFAAKLYITARYGIESGADFQKRALNVRKTYFEYRKRLSRVNKFEHLEWRLAHPHDSRRNQEFRRPRGR